MSIKEEKFLRERLDLIEKEIGTLTERVDSLGIALKELEELKQEIKGIKLFLGRVHPDFKSQFPEIMKKLRG
jgi:prefoldin subunit 5